MHLHSPYLRGEGKWLRANLHAHTTNSDGRRSPQELVDTYGELGYDVLMITDHDKITPVDDLDPKNLVLLTGNEITANGPHLCHIGASTAIAPHENRQQVIDEINAACGMAIVNHPNWEILFDHCPFETMFEWQNYHGIEIYNGVGERHPGDPLATNKWDRMLSSGRWVWAYANDDTHRPDIDEGRAWNMIWAREKTAEGVMEALHAGSSYCTTGVLLKHVGVEGNVISVECENAQRVVALTDYGKRLMAVDTSRMDFAVPDDFPGRYLRFECWGWGDHRAWTQPFFVQR